MAETKPSKTQQIKNEAARIRAASDTLSNYINQNKDTLRAQNSGISNGGSKFLVLVELRGAYEQLAKALDKRAEMEEAEATRKANEPRPVFLPGI